jgi:6-phosphogluconolactonase
LSGRANLIVLDDGAALAAAVAARFVERGRAAIEARGRFFIALAGGSTPKASYALIAASERDALDWNRVRFFFGDERCVPPDSDASNFKMALTNLMAPLQIPAEHVFRMHGEDDPAAAARAYAEVVVREVPAESGVPVFDLVMLGMGPDGHTASLFPGSDPHEDDAALVRAPFVAKFGTHRLTLTPRVLTAARVIDVATAGPTKTAALAAVLEGPPDPVRYPISVLADAGDRVTWLVDRIAAAQLADSVKAT